MLSELARADLEVWGFNGLPLVACGSSLPVVRHKSTNRFCALSVTRKGGLAWSTPEEIEEHLRLGRVARLSKPLELPEAVFPLSPTAQPLVAWARPEFWWSLGLTKDDAIAYHAQSLGWASQLVSEARAQEDAPPANGDARPTPSDSEPEAERLPEPVSRTLWVCCAPAGEVEHDLDRWAQEYRSRYDDQLVSEQPPWATLEQQARSGLCAARTPAVRYPLYVRYCAALYFRPPQSGNGAGSGPERGNQIFRLFVRREFPEVNWDQFRADMAVVMGWSRDQLRFRMETAAAEAQGKRAAQTAMVVGEQTASRTQSSRP
jgi:hypothetical protein